MRKACLTCNKKNFVWGAARLCRKLFFVQKKKENDIGELKHEN